MSAMTEAQILAAVADALRPLLSELQLLRSHVAELTAERDQLATPPRRLNARSISKERQPNALTSIPNRMNKRMSAPSLT
jgi:hypothetical protein